MSPAREEGDRAGGSSRSTLAVLFPGQGSQAPGMGREIAREFPEAQRIYEEADQVLGFELSRLCFEGPEEELRRTAITQPAILTTSVALWSVLRERGVRPELVAGHSLGEYSAVVAAGGLSFADAVTTVHLRGRLMQEAVPEGEGAMAALVGLQAPAVIALCREEAQGQVLEPANFNAPDQIVVAGHTPAVERAVKAAEARGARRAIRLPVSAPFHCSLMEPVRAGLEKHLRTVKFHDPEVPVVSNVDAQMVRTADAVRDALIRQVTAPVLWADSMGQLSGWGVTRALEVGPGRVLTGLLRRIDRSVACRPVADPGGVEKALGGDD